MRRTLLALAMAFAASAIATGTAFAGTYQVAACAGPTLLINNSWQPFNNNPTYLETSANCGSDRRHRGQPEHVGARGRRCLATDHERPRGRDGRLAVHRAGGR